MYIESGEIEVPVKNNLIMRDIHLPKNVVFACMAETIVLALEGRFEQFTIGRNIEWKKVKEIYKLGLKHGMKLAAISGVNGVYKQKEIDAFLMLCMSLYPLSFCLTILNSFLGPGVFGASFRV